MYLDRLLLNNFRNYEQAEIEISEAEAIFLVGKNGQGKTNFLEALYYLSYGNSFRTKKESQVIFHNKDYYRIQGNLRRNSIEHTLEISFFKNKKKILYNQSPIKNRKEMLQIFPTVIFKHSDFYFVSGAPEFQRQYLDQILVLNSVDYVQAFQQYKKILLYKNTCLKQEKYEMLPVYNEQLAYFGITIIKNRKKVVDYINKKLEKMFTDVFGEYISLKMSYSTNWFDEEQLEKELDLKKTIGLLNNQQEQEKKYKTCISGPHRDNIKIMNEDYEFKNIASTGQIRIISLLLRTIQALYYEEQNNKQMIYLFDDVLLELDNEKQSRFIKYLPKPAQSFYTFLPDEKLPNIVESKKKKYFLVEKGNLIEQ